MSFETQSFKPENKKVIKIVWTAWREPYLFFFTFRSHQLCKRPVQKEKLQFRELNLREQQTSFSAIFLLNKITASSPGTFYFLALTSKREDALGNEVA